MSPDYLTAFESANSCKEIKAIVDGALKSLQVIEPWREASTNNPQLQQVIEKIQGHSVVYFEAIDKSIKTAQDGYRFSCDVIELCTQLLNPDTNQVDLQKYIEDMKSTAKKAHEDSKDALKKFREVRIGLLEITKTIPRQALAAPEGKGLLFRIRTWVTSGRRDIRKAIKELHLAALDMGELSENVDKFANWWSGMQTILEAEDDNANNLKPERNKIRVDQIQKTWMDIRVDYLQYKAQIIRLQDHYHPETS